MTKELRQKGARRIRAEVRLVAGQKLASQTRRAPASYRGSWLTRGQIQEAKGPEISRAMFGK